MCKSYQPEDPGLNRVSDLFSQEIMDGALAGQVAYEGKMIIRQKGSILVGALATAVLVGIHFFIYERIRNCRRKLR